MPIYEEKLISPLALRFTQQRIRTTFRDGREVEAAIRQITAGPAVGDYDVVLRAPFPTIEIIRYSPHGRGAEGQGEDDHWFTFDNRRLYCLQRAAAEYWPKRVGAVVEVLYADTGAIRKKLDSMTCGVSVSIGHVFAAHLDEWAWLDAVRERAPPGLGCALEAEAAIVSDDAKACVEELLDAPAEADPVARLLAGLAAEEAQRGRAPSEDSSSRETPSTAATEPGRRLYSHGASEGSLGVGDAADSPEALLETVRRHLAGTYVGEKKETYTVAWKGSQWNCVREDSHSTKRFTIEEDIEEACLWWGIQKTYYVSLSELAEEPTQLRWYGARDAPGRRPRFVWHLLQTEAARKPEAHAGWAPPQKQKAQPWSGNAAQESSHAKQKKWQQKPQGGAHKNSAAAPRSKWVAVANNGGA